jgi:hypothetical protein
VKKKIKVAKKIPIAYTTLWGGLIAGMSFNDILILSLVRSGIVETDTHDTP